MKAETRAIKMLQSLEGIGSGFCILSESDKKILSKMPEKKGVLNKGVAEALSREVTIAFSHNEKFRPPPCAIVLLSHNEKIVGEMTNCGRKFYNGSSNFDMHILPPVPFPELESEFQGVCSASPGYEADKVIRTLIKVGAKDATLLIGLNRKESL